MDTLGGPDRRAARVVAALAEGGLIDPQRSTEAEAMVGSALDTGPDTAPHTTPGPAVTAGHGHTAPVRGRLTEVAGYVGGALVLAAAVVFLAQEWPRLGLGGQLVALGVISLALLGTAGAVVLTGRQPVRRRLAGTLGTGGALSAAFAVGVLADDQVQRSNPYDVSVPWLAGSAAMLLIGLGVYLVAATALGQISIAGAAFAVLVAGIEVLSDDFNVALFAVLVLALGLLWLAVAERGAWRERSTGLVLGCLLTLVGAQLPLLDGVQPAFAYALTAAVAVAAVVAYVGTRSLPYLATGVAGITLVVPEALLDWTEGSLGPVGVLLAAGLTLLLASLLGLRLRQQVAAA